MVSGYFFGRILFKKLNVAGFTLDLIPNKNAWMFRIYIGFHFGHPIPFICG